MNSDNFTNIRLFDLLPEDQQQWLIFLTDTWPLSFQQRKIITEFCVDMLCWKTGSLEQFYSPEKLGNHNNKHSAKLLFHQLKDGYDSLKNNPKIYKSQTNISQTSAVESTFPQEHMIPVALEGNIMGTCPVASDKTRCCNLQTLDVVQQCGFACSYCSIQSFYHGNQVRFIKELPNHLNNLKIDPHTLYHIGTGQSSDSLMWGNKFGLLDSLCNFATTHQNVILEMKSKSSRIDYFLQNRPPSNMVFTWSLNPTTVILHEEKGAAPLEKRLASARKIADLGCPVGFHFHPIVWYEGWQEDYTNIVTTLTEMFSPDEVVMVSLGTLTFIKSVMKRIRNRILQSSILQMPMEEISGKMSYPFEIKKDLFTSIYNSFPKQWQENVFFYMCMEDIRLWDSVFGRNYPSNEDFENDMLSCYHNKIRMIKQAQSCL